MTYSRRFYPRVRNKFIYYYLWIINGYDDVEKRICHSSNLRLHVYVKLTSTSRLKAFVSTSFERVLDKSLSAVAA